MYGIALSKYQEEAIQWAINHRFCGLFLPMGAGKTLSTLLAIQHSEQYPWLIVAPPTVALWTWKDETLKWQLPLRVISLDGSPKQRKTKLSFDAEIYTISCSTFHIAYEEGLLSRFKCVVIDEISMFRSIGSDRHKAMWKMRKRLNRLIGLTGTPCPNGLESVFGIIKLIDPNVLGQYRTKFLEEYFQATRYVNNIPVKWKPLPLATEKIEKKIATVTYSCPQEEYPLKCTIIDVYGEMTKKQYSVYQSFKKEYIAELPGGTLTAATAGVLGIKLQQLANGTVYTDTGTAHVHDIKLQLLKDLLAQADDNMLIVYTFKSEKDKLLGLPGVEQFNITKWNRGKQKAAMVHPASVGYGLNLQTGGSIIVFYGLTWNMELYSQMIQRLFRKGQTKDVRVYRLLTKGTIDEKITMCMKGKINMHEAFMEALQSEV